jgi:hypothetical protein
MILLVVILLVVRVESFTILPFKFVAERVDTFAVEYTVRKLVDVVPENIVLPDKLEKFITDVVRSFVAALNAVMVHPDAVEKTSDFTFIAFAVMVLATFIEQRTYNEFPIVMFCVRFTNGALIVVDCIDCILILLLLNRLSSLVVLI